MDSYFLSLRFILIRQSIVMLTHSHTHTRTFTPAQTLRHTHTRPLCLWKRILLAFHPKLSSIGYFMTFVYIIHDNVSLGQIYGNNGPLSQLPIRSKRHLFNYLFHLFWATRSEFVWRINFIDSIVWGKWGWRQTHKIYLFTPF